MNIIKNPDRNQWPEILSRPSFDFEALMNSVASILSNVKKNGDKALIEYTKEYDHAEMEEFRVTEVEITAAGFKVDEKLKNAIQLAKSNIEKFHSIQKHPLVSCETSPGVTVWQKSLAIEKVGLYIPGGTAPLLSTVLMLGIPAKLAGCSEIIICSPPNQDGSIDPTILFTANLLGIRDIFKLGGAQAIAAMAYGTESVPRVYKIFGPGNQYVTAAKLKVSLENVAIDMPAGPSELAIIADRTSNPAFIASDLLSQAEHGADSQVIMVSTSESMINRVLEEIDIQLADLPRKDLAKKSLDNSKFILLKDENAVVDLINEYAPEHLSIVTENYKDLSNRIVNAGSVFLGKYTPESAGDYASGTNHTLPTNGNARAYSGVNIASFMKKISYQEISKYGLFNIGPAVERMAAAEDLEAHRRAVSVRMKGLNNYKV